jgi:DNA-binding response OmpR family regulator
MKKIVVIDDEPSIRELVSMLLKREGYEVASAEDGKTGLEIIKTFQPDLLILDLMLPDSNGYEICKKLCSSYSFPIMMLTAKNDIVDKVVGLEIGADDYITKPFDSRELLVRVKALLRRTTSKAVKIDYINYEDLTINLSAKTVCKNGRQIALSPNEYQLLELFVQNPQKVFTREELLLKVWGYDYLGDSRTVDITVTRLRKKIEDDCKDPKYIATVFGFGYCCQRSS